MVPVSIGTEITFGKSCLVYMDFVGIIGAWAVTSMLFDLLRKEWAREMAE